MTIRMRLGLTVGLVGGCVLVMISLPEQPVLAAAQSAAAGQRINLAERFAGRTLSIVNREVTRLQDRADGVHVSEREDNGLVWIDGSDFAEGTIEADVRGRDVQQRSFVGIAFHGQNNTTYEAVYVRVFNFRATDPERHQHAVQYIMPPDFDWPRLRKEFPEEFENPVEASVSPTDWVPLRIVVAAKTVRIYVGRGMTTPTLEVRKLGMLERGRIGLWVGNTSDGDFANLRVTPMK
jgi:hypothetical protein